MSNRYHLTVVCLMMVLILSATDAFSAQRAAAVSVSPFAGAYLFDNEQQLKDRAVYGLAVGYNFDRRWTGEASVSGILTEEDVSGGEDVDITQARLDILYHFRPERAFVPFLAVGAGAARLSPDGLDNDTDFLFAYGAGFKYFFTERVALRLDARHILDVNDEDLQREDDLVHNLSVVGGLSFQFGGVQPAPSRRQEQAEAAVEPQPVTVEEEPPAVTDSDHDGVNDERDRCPETPRETAVAADGCPEIVTFVDADNDGVADALDACPDTPAGVAVDLRGCPLPDSDGDGVVDAHDKCPATEATIAVDRDGCPELTEELKIAGLVIEYTTSQSGFGAQAARELKLLAAKIKSTGQGRLVVEGHTDSVGSESFNLKLSQQRADKVRQALINDFGVAADRVVAKGYGSADPVAGNGTQEGRQQNRRVVVRYQP
ncbi:MAG TPA: OmpA family protein [Geopsychrobacteraceae bacterium]